MTEHNTGRQARSSRIAAYQTGGDIAAGIGGGGAGWTKVACGEHGYTEHGFDVLVRLNSGHASFENGDYLAPRAPGVSTALTEELVLEHRLRR